MNTLKQLTIILCVGMVSVIIRETTGIPLPANVIGILLLLILLVSKVVKLDDIETVSDFLLANLALLFIPLGVSLMNYFDVLGENLWKFFLVCLLSTIITFYVTAKTVSILRNIKGAK